MLKIYLTFWAILKYSLSLVFIFCLPILRAQGLIDDVLRLAEMIDISKNGTDEDLTTTVNIANAHPLGILAAYAYPNRTDALKMGINPYAILHQYRNNPYLQPLLVDTTLWRKLAADLDASAVEHTVENIRNPQRERMTGISGRSDLYAGNLLLDAPKLIVDYQSRRETNDQAQRTSARQLMNGTSDPAALTANVLTGLADWIGKRAKEELAQNFLLRLTENLRNKQIDVLFPSTFKYLSNLDITNYRSIMLSARQVFSEDLNQLPFSVPSYLIKKTENKAQSNDPFVLNSLLVNRMVDLSRRDIPLPTLMSQVGGDFSRRRFENEKILHDSIVKMENSVAYDNLRSSFNRVLHDLTTSFERLDLARRAIDHRVGEVDYPTFLTNWEKRLEVLKVEKQAVVERDQANSDSNINITSGRPLKDIEADSLNADNMVLTFLQLDQRYNTLQAEIQSFGYESFFEHSNGSWLQSIEDFLDGQLDYEVLFAFASFEKYATLFNEAPPSPDTLRAVGLTMIKELLRRNEMEYLLVTKLHDYAQLLAKLEAESSKFEILVRVTEERVPTFIGELREKLCKKINDEKDFWEDVLPRNDRQIRALEYLDNLAQNVDAELSGQNEYRSLLEQLDYLQEVEKLFIGRIDTLQKRYRERAQDSPYWQSNAGSSRTILANIRPNLDQSRKSLNALQAAVDSLQKDVLPLQQSYTNAQVFSGVLQTGAVVLSALATTEQNPRTSQLKWISPDRLSQVLDQETPRQVFLGLLHQRLASTTAGLPISTEGLEQVISRMAVTLQGTDTINDKSARFVNRLEVASDLINTLLETPLIRTGGANQSLVDMYREFLGNVPAINRELTALVRHTEKREYRYGFDNVLRLIELLKVYPPSNTARSRKLEARLKQATSDEDKQKWTQKLSSLKSDPDNYTRFRNDVFRYGQFIADIAGADDSEAVAAAFQNMAAPRGSSLNKRVKSGSIDLNAYFGGSVSHEFVKKTDPGHSTVAINSYGLFVPVGLAFSKRFGDSTSVSFSLFLPLIDLGALTTYRTDAVSKGVEVLPDVTFANVLAPGVHLFMNFPKSPLFLGAGYQFGPNVREYSLSSNGETTTKKVSAQRLMLTFGIDVPLISFTGNR